MPTLVLFDIDGTMLVTGRAGIVAMEEAGRELFGPGFTSEGVDVAGRLDPLIIADMLATAGLAHTPAAEARLRERYVRRLGERLSRHDCAARALDGVPALIQRLQAAPGVTIGVLTGNFAEAGRMKMTHVGIDPDAFSVAAWGDESPKRPPSRDDLPPVAMERYRRRHGTPIDPAEVVIIGDTPHDVRCAAVNGCRSLAVATGRFSQSQLVAAGADLAVPDLSPTDVLTEWIFGP